MAGNFKNKNGGQAASVTKADAILQRQAELAAKLDQLLAATGALARDNKTDAVEQKLATESSYLSKQTSAIYEKLAAENKSLRQEMGYLALQCENVFTKLAGMIGELSQKVGENAVDYDRIAQSVDYDRIAGAVDYDRIASVFAEQLSPAEDEDAAIEDEVAPAAYSEEETAEQLTIPGYIDYEELAARISEKLRADGAIAVDCDELAKKVADSLPPQEVISPDYIASKVAEQIVIPQVVIGEQGEARPVEIVPANIDYDELAARIAEKVFPEEDYEEAVAEAAAEDAPQEAEPAAETAQEAETVVDAAAEEEIAEESGEPAEDDALADEIARKVSELSPNDFDIIVDDEGCRSLA